MLQIVLQGWAPGLGGVDMTQSDLDLKMTLVSPSLQVLGGFIDELTYHAIRAILLMCILQCSRPPDFMWLGTLL